MLETKQVDIKNVISSVTNIGFIPEIKKRCIRSDKVGICSHDQYLLPNEYNTAVKHVKYENISLCVRFLSVM